MWPWGLGFMKNCFNINLLFFFCKGTARRKKKVVHRTATADDKKLQFSLKKLGVNNISGIEEVIPSNEKALFSTDMLNVPCQFNFNAF